uniref:Uncharacterized protein n=1 Tax=Panagrellus redivivus TaxID=6233 RepID=A0A7E4VH23_PANRE
MLPLSVCMCARRSPIEAHACMTTVVDDMMLVVRIVKFHGSQPNTAKKGATSQKNEEEGITTKRKALLGWSIAATRQRGPMMPQGVSSVVFSQVGGCASSMSSSLVSTGLSPRGRGPSRGPITPQASALPIAEGKPPSLMLTDDERGKKGGSSGKKEGHRLQDPLLGGLDQAPLRNTPFLPVPTVKVVVIGAVSSCLPSLNRLFELVQSRKKRFLLRSNPIQSNSRGSTNPKAPGNNTLKLRYAPALKPIGGDRGCDHRLTTSLQSIILHLEDDG